MCSRLKIRVGLCVILLITILYSIWITCHNHIKELSEWYIDTGVRKALKKSDTITVREFNYDLNSPTLLREFRSGILCSEFADNFRVVGSCSVMESLGPVTAEFGTNGEVLCRISMIYRGLAVVELPHCTKQVLVEMNTIASYSNIVARMGYDAKHVWSDINDDEVPGLEQ